MKEEAVRTARMSIPILVTLVLFTGTIPGVLGHAPGVLSTPEFEINDIVIVDGGKELTISLKDVGLYHNEIFKNNKMKMMKAQNKTQEQIDAAIKKEFEGADGICPCVITAFRATLLGIGEIWGDELPERKDIRIISSLPTMGSMQVFQYITGTASNVPDVTEKGQFKIILPNGTEVKDFSKMKIKVLSMNNSMENYHFNIESISSGESYEAVYLEAVYPEGYFELRLKVKMNYPEDATTEDNDEFTVMYEDVRDSLLSSEDWELFEDVDEPEEDTPVVAIVFSLLLLTIFVGLIVWQFTVKKK